MKPRIMILEEGIVRIKTVYLIGSCARNECFGPKVLDYLLLIDIIPPGHAYLVAAPGVKAIVLPDPSLTCNKLLNPVTGKASSIYTSRIASEPKVLVHGSRVTVKEYHSFNATDLKHYLFYLWIMVKTGKRKYIARYPCKILYETLWLKTFLKENRALKFSWHSLAEKYSTDEIAEYCLQVLLKEHRLGNNYQYILNYIENLLDKIGQEYLGEKLNELIEDIEFFRQTSPRLGGGVGVC